MNKKIKVLQVIRRLGFGGADFTGVGVSVTSLISTGCVYLVTTSTGIGLDLTTGFTASCLSTAAAILSAVVIFFADVLFLDLVLVVACCGC